MDWIKENKFLAGWLGVTLLGAGALSFLVLQAKGKYETATTDFEAKAMELSNLQGKKPYPDEDNLKKMGDLQKNHQKAIDDLHARLVGMEIPLAPMTPEKFQDELRESVRRVTAKAAEKGVKIGGEKQNFYMGFDKYQAEPPKPEAAAPLARMLKAMELAMNILLDTNPSDITDLKRENLPEEGSDKEAKATPAPSRGAAQKDKDKKDLVERRHFDVSFVAPELSFRKFVNALLDTKDQRKAYDKEQFFIPKSVVVKNEKEQGPHKAVAAPVAPPPPPPDPNNPNAPAPAPAPAEKEEVKYVVGEEKLQVAIRVDVVDFADLPAAKPAK